MDSAEEQRIAVRKFRAAFRNAPKTTPVHQLQEHAARPRSFKGPIWASNVTIPALPDVEGDELRAKLWQVFQSKGDGSEILDYPKASVPLHGEWIAARKSATNPDGLSEEEKFRHIEQECDTSLTLFYLSGNGWMRSGPPGSRPLTHQLSHHSSSRVFTMRTRLAPQNTLPTIILDALIGYLYLIAPPPSALHSPIPPSSIILTGESGGATLHLAILQFLQYFLRSSPPTTLQIFTHPSIPLTSSLLPRACAFVSPPMDLLSALPAASANEPIDWMPQRGPWFNDSFPADHLWPSTPPRAEIYIDPSAMMHPMIQPTLCPEADWRGMPPMWVACGQERYADGIKYWVRSVRRAGVRVRFEEYEGMVHSFCVGMPWMRQSRECVRRWGVVSREMGEGGTGKEKKEEGEAGSWAEKVAMGALGRTKVGFEDLIRLEEEEVRSRMRERVERLKGLVWRGPTTTTPQSGAGGKAKM